jgi:hypothetical protein
MQTRYRAAATALLLTATAGLAATGGAAEASGTHHADRSSNRLVITIKTAKGAMTLSDNKIRPGNTVFKVAPHGKGSSGKQVFRLKPGYTLNQAFTDLQKAFGGDVPSVKRVDRRIVFYGGNQMNPRGGDPTYWGIALNHPGTYYVLDIDRNSVTKFHVGGMWQRRSLPSKDGWVNAATKADGVSNTFHTGRHDASSGWMKSTNNALEPHFFDLGHVKQRTTRQDVKNCFNGGACNFPARDHASASAGVISPGKRMVWSYSLTPGKYLVDCFWPSRETGMPHAFMGMYRLFQLH